MDEVNPKRVHSGLSYFSLETPNDGTHGTPKQNGLPRFNIYKPGTIYVSSTSENNLGVGTKTFFWSSELPVLSYGDLIEIISTQITPIEVNGYMLGMVESYSYVPGVGSTIVVNCYQAYGDVGATNVKNWNIKLQLNDGANIVQNPDSPYMAKLSVYDPSFSEKLGFANFFVPTRIDSEIFDVVDEEDYYAFKTKLKLVGLVSVQENMGDIHQPYLGTTITIKKPYKIETKITTWTYDPDNFFEPPVVTTSTTYEDDPREYSHTFTSFDFDPESPDFQPSEGHYPSSQSSETPEFVDILINSFEEIKTQFLFPDSDPPIYVWRVTQRTVVTYNDPHQEIIDVTPPSFFEPPTP